MTPLEGDELLVVVGETASGKTGAAIDLARELGGEIIGADSVQVYRGFDVGSAKPTAAELGSIRHHLLDVADPGEAFDAGRFVELADSAIADVRARGRIPIVCGGTYLWVRALIFGLANAPRGDDAMRAALREELERVGKEAFHARLAAIDPIAAARLHPNDVVRVTRAIEVHATTGETLSSLQEAHGFRTPRHRARMIAIRRPREEHEARIVTRVQQMLANGWIEEVRGLVERGHGGARAMAAIGYSQVRAFVEGTVAEADLEGTIVRATRVFARHQRTWLAKANVQWIEP